MVDMQKLFSPEYVAVAGVSPRPDNMASLILLNLVNWKYGGKMIGINPACAGASVLGVPVYASLDDAPAGVDVLVCLSPARTVPDLALQCGRARVPFMIVETSGFNEYDEAGAEFGRQLRRNAREAGTRLVGPNCLGIISVASKFCGAFTWLEPFPAGKISLVSQSGGVALTMIMGLAEHNIAIGKFISMGNKFDLNESDYLEYLKDDPDTDIILMFLESIVDGRRFAQIASRCEKPIIAYKAGSTEAGRERAGSHTAALANDDRVVSAALERAGVVRAHTISDVMHFASMFRQPKMRGNRLGVISPAGGLTVVSADECSHAGFEFPSLDSDTAAHIRGRRRAGVIRTENPLDLGDAFDSEIVFDSVRVVVSQKNMDAGMVLLQRRPTEYYNGMLQVMAPNIIPDIEKLSAKIDKPIVTIVYGRPGVVVENRGAVKTPVYTSTDIALRAMSAYRDWCARTANRPAPLSTVRPRVPAAAKKILEAAAPGETLLGAHAFALLEAFGVPCAACEEIEKTSQAAAAMKRLGGGPVAMKIVCAEMSHKSDAGGVRLGITGAKEAAKVAGELFAVLETRRLSGTVLVQKMGGQGIELIIGGRRDPSFGPIVLFGIGGIFVEIIRDTALALAPVSREEAGALARSLSGSALLTGARGMKPVDMKSVADSIVSASRLLAACEAVAELDINPLIASPDGATAVDARIVLK